MNQEELKEKVYDVNHRSSKADEVFIIEIDDL